MTRSADVVQRSSKPAFLGRNVYANDANPLSRIMTEPRFFPPDFAAVEKRLASVPRDGGRASINLSMFYQPGHRKRNCCFTGIYAGNGKRNAGTI